MSKSHQTGHNVQPGKSKIDIFWMRSRDAERPGEHSHGDRGNEVRRSIYPPGAGRDAYF